VTAEQDSHDEVTEEREPTSTAVEGEAVDSPASAAVDGDSVEPKASTDTKRGIVGRAGQAAKRHWVSVALAVILLATIGVTTWMFFFVYKPDRATNDEAVQSAVKAASDGTVALLSYSPESLDQDFATAKSKLTGSFLSYYTQFTEQIVAPAAKQKAVKTQAAVVRAAPSEIRPDSAVVLVFINQTTQSKDRTDPSFINSAVRVTLQKINGGWLISSFDPV
jgi:Mce-associated membrane protein